jgi:hypothetical protein
MKTTGKVVSFSRVVLELQPGAPGSSFKENRLYSAAKEYVPSKG